jgi:hypothetical protein
MKRVSNIWIIAVAALVFGCSGDINRSSSPVELVVTNTQNLNRFDLLVGAANCDQDVGSVLMQAIVKNSATADNRFNDVRITRYRVSYVRTDGGHAVPATFVRSIDTLLTANGGNTALSKFLVVESDALNQAPFASLLPVNGGRDPETGRPVVKMEIVLEVFGQTLAGENVSGSTRFPLDFCFDCGGCA